MLPALIRSDDASVDERLRDTFGVSRLELIQIVKEVVGARADAVENDPVTAAGQFAYIHGTRNLRALFRSRGWELTRKDNIELVKHPDRNLMIGYQSVDLAASEMHSPRAISGKGVGSERAIDAAQTSLFSGADWLPAMDTTVPINAGLWSFCVSVDGDEVRAELSLSSGISGGNFKGFIERIFIVKNGDWAQIMVLARGDEAADFEPVVTRK